MKVSYEWRERDENNQEVIIKFLDDDGKKTMHTLTVVVDDPEGRYGSIDTTREAFRKAKETLPQIFEEMQKQLEDVLKTY